MAKIKELEEDELTIARKEIATQKEANEKLSAELILVRKELVFQNEEKGKRAEELIIADKELAFQNEEKEKRAAELIIANIELAFQKEEKRKVESPLLENESSFYNTGADPSEQKKVENVLQESEEKFKLIFEKSISPIMVADDKGNYLEVNKAAAEIFEYSINELMGMNVGDLITTSNPNAAAQYEEYIKKGEEIGEFGFISKKGTPKIVQYQAVRIKPDFNLSILMDVTGQKKSSQYARSLIEASLDPLVTISVAGKILDVNEASVKVTGVPREKLIDTDFSNYFTEPTKAQEGYQQVFEKGFVADYPLTIKHKNGNLIDVLYNASVYKDDKGNVLGVFAAARDVTSQKQASQYARSLIEASLDPLVTISISGKILDVNEASVKATGVPREKLIDTDFSNYFTEPTKAQEGYQQVFEKGFVADYPLTIKHKNGNLTDVLYNASVYKDDKGNVLGVFAAARDVTSQKQASQYARSLIEASLDPLVTISISGKILDVNEASVKATGVPREKLIDTDFSNYFTEPTKAQEGYLQVFENGFVADYPLTIKHKNGNLIDVLYNASIYKDDKGNVLGVFAAARDVTSQKQASQYARSLIEASLDPLVTISVDGKITDVNEASIKVTGVPREKLIDTDFSNYFTEPKKAQEGYRQVFENGFVADYPLTIKHKNGNLTDVLYNASVYKDDKGNVLGVFAAARDVTEQKWAKDLRIANKELAFQNDEKEKRAAELIIANNELAFQNEEKEKRAAELIIANKELVIESDEKERRADQLTLANIEIQRNYEEHFSHMANLMPDKITTTNADGIATFFNQNWIDYSGYTFEELIGFGWNHIMHPDETAEIQKRWTQSLTTGEDFEMEMQCLSKNDGYKWFLTRAVPIKEANGIIKSWIGTSTEIQRGKEEQQRKDNFIKMVSHELKTPVTSIKGYVQMLLMILSEEHAEPFPMQIKNSLLRVDYQVTRLTRLITEMLDLSRIEADKLELQQELFSINALVKDTINDISLTNPKHTIHLLFEFVCNMYGDRGRIEQVVINLVTNAIKYSANNNKVEVSIRKGEKNMVLVSVRDFGIGIDKADHKKIFDRFFRVEGKMEQTFAGFGIGLFIAKEIIVRHNGYITVESEKGQGSVFTFAFPYTTETNL